MSSNAVVLTVLYFAAAREAVGTSQERVTLPSTSFSLADLPALLVKLHDGNEALVAALKRSALSLNEELILREDEVKTMLKADNVVAIIPPVSGG